VVLSPDRRRSERAIVLQLLRDDHAQWWTRGELRGELRIALAALVDSLDDLEQHGVVVTAEDDRVLASPCARRLDELELIGV
jgi:DNA-binding HxlR family transcriptional regulator